VAALALDIGQEVQVVLGTVSPRLAESDRVALQTSGIVLFPNFGERLERLGVVGL